LEETDSPLAKTLLEDKEFNKFTKVMPREYKRVLLAQAKAKKDGTDPMEAVMEVSRG
jgi:glutamate synthase (NADPH) large chain